MAHIARNNVAGIWPGGVLVRIIVRPHAVIGAPPGEKPPADMIVKERRVHLAVKIFTGQLLHRHLLCMAMAAESLIALPEPEWHPTDFVFNGDDFQIGIAFEYASKNNVKKRILDLSGLLDTDPIPADAVGGLPVHTGAKTRKNVKMNRQLEILRGGPKALVMFRGERQLFMRHLPNHRADYACLLAALHLGDGIVNVINGNERDAVESIRNFLAVIDQPIVVGSK